MNALSINIRTEAPETAMVERSVAAILVTVSALITTLATPVIAYIQNQIENANQPRADAVIARIEELNHEVDNLVSDHDGDIFAALSDPKMRILEDRKRELQATINR